MQTKNKNKKVNPFLMASIHVNDKLLTSWYNANLSTNSYLNSPTKSPVKQLKIDKNMKKEILSSVGNKENVSATCFEVSMLLLVILKTPKFCSIATFSKQA